MKPIAPRRLQLTRETLRELTPAELEALKGGDSNPPPSTRQGCNSGNTPTVNFRADVDLGTG